MADRFGNDVQGQIERWFYHTMVPNLKIKYGEDMAVAVVVLDPAQPANPAEPLSTAAHIVAVGNPDKITSDEGLLANVRHKLLFCLRTGLPSSEAALRPDLVEPGDFPFEGAGTYRGYTGGASGLKEESDWWVFCRVVDQVIDYRANAALRPIQACKERRPGWKYLEGEKL